MESKFYLAKNSTGNNSGLSRSFKSFLNGLLQNSFPSAVRIMYNFEKYQFILVGKEIEPKVFASTVDWPEYNINWWSSYYFATNNAPDPNYETEFIGKDGNMKASSWFYETNLKIRIVKQIRGINNEYLGEIAVDFYKLRDFNKLFSNIE